MHETALETHVEKKTTKTAADRGEVDCHGCRRNPSDVGRLTVGDRVDRASFSHRPAALNTRLKPPYDFTH